MTRTNREMVQIFFPLHRFDFQCFFPLYRFDFLPLSKKMILFFKSFGEFWESEFSANSGTCNLSNLQVHISSTLHNSITAVPLAQFACCPDWLVWSVTAGGKFTSKTAYLWLLKGEDSVLHFGFNQVWKLMLPEKMRTFYVARHGRILCNPILYD